MEMDMELIQKMDAQIKSVRRAAHELKRISGGIQAIDRNVDRILASVKMLEINVSDIVNLNVKIK